MTIKISSHSEQWLLQYYFMILKWYVKIDITTSFPNHVICSAVIWQTCLIMENAIKGITLYSVMKKILVFLLAFLYITSSCDATVYMHFCMGKAVGFSFTPEKSSGCHRCGMKKSGKGMGCCKDEQKIIKSDKSQKLTDLTSSSTQEKKYSSVLWNYPDFSISCGQLSTINRQPHGPPGADPVPAYVLNCVFLI